MKKNLFNLALTAALVGGLSLGVTSCSDDDDNKNDEAQTSTVTVAGDLLSHGIETDMQSAVVSVPVSSTGEWTATLAKGTDWVHIQGWQVNYSGNQALTLLFDENRSGRDRNTTLNIANNDGELTRVKVYQYYNYKGEAPTNGSGAAFAAKGMGCGIDYDYALNLKNIVARADAEAAKSGDKSAASGSFYSPTQVHKPNNIFNIARIEELQKSRENPLQASAYVEAVIPVAEMNVQLYDSCLSQAKTLDVGMEMSLSLGPISGRARGEYSSKMHEDRTIVNYSIVRNAPMYNVYLSPAELSAYATDPRHNKVSMDYDDAAFEQIDQLIEAYKKRNARRRGLVVNDRGLTDEQEEIIANMEDQVPVMMDFAGIFSTNFTKSYNELYNAIVRQKQAGKSIDAATANQVLNALDNNYGPFFIAGGDFGGSLAVYCEIHRDSLHGSDALSGEVSAEMSGMFEISGKIEYSSVGMSYLRQSNTQMDIYGGSANATANAFLSLITGSEPSNLQRWQQVMDDWIRSMWTTSTGTSYGEPKISEAAPISFSVTPIWTLFAEPDIQEYVQNYFLTKYADRGIRSYFGLMNGTLPDGQGEAFSNLNSDFWK